VIGLGYVLLVILAAVAAPLITTCDPNSQDLKSALLPPSAEHWFGTDHFGRDIYTRVVYGARISLRVGPIATGIAMLIGIPLGLLAAYYLGWIDVVISRVIDVLLAFPGLLLAMGIMAVLGPGLTNAMIATGVSMLPRYVRVTRASTLSIKGMDYIIAARAIGASDRHIMVHHLLPNVILPLIVLASLDVAGAILFAAGLSFLGLGAQPPTPDWGGMLSRARIYMQQAPWFAFFPGLAITSTILALNMVGDGLRDALDPHLTIKQ